MLSFEFLGFDRPRIFGTQRPIAVELPEPELPLFARDFVEDLCDPSRLYVLPEIRLEPSSNVFIVNENSDCFLLRGAAASCLNRPSLGRHCADRIFLPERLP